MERIEDIKHLRRVLAAIQEQSVQTQLKLIAELGKTSLFFLAWNILGFKDIDPVLHWDMCKQWEHEARDKLLLCPRGTFKTSIFTIAGSIFEIINNPNIRILVSNATLSNAKLILKGIKDHFIHNEYFRTLYPDFCPEVNAGKKSFREFGTQEEFRVMNQRPGIRESTVEINSVDGNVVSRHYELHIGDDLVNDKNVTTKDQIDKVEGFIRAVYSLLEPGIGRNVLIGTRWHFDDPYGRIIDSKGSRGYLVYIRRILEEDETGKKVSIFPKRFSPGEIKKIKKQQAHYLFSCQYLNDPLPEEDQIFKRDWIKYYDILPHDILERLWIVTSIDPAVSGSRFSDMSAIVTVGVDHNDDIYVLEILNSRMDTSVLIESIFEVDKRWSPVKIGIETFAFQKTIKNVVEWEMRRKKIYIPLVQLETDTTKSKEARIRGLQPRIQYSNFYVKKNMFDLVDQMLRFPRAKHDDLIDALANAQQLFRTPGYRPMPRRLTGKTFDQILKTIKKSYQSKRIGRDHLMEG